MGGVYSLMPGTRTADDIWTISELLRLVLNPCCTRRSPSWGSSSVRLVQKKVKFCPAVSRGSPDGLTFTQMVLSVIRNIQLFCAAAINDNVAPAMISGKFLPNNGPILDTEMDTPAQQLTSNRQVRLAPIDKRLKHCWSQPHSRSHESTKFLVNFFDIESLA